MKKLFYKVFFLGILFVVSMIGYIIFSGTRENNATAELAMVLGTEVYRSGTCSTRLQARLDRAIKLYHDKKCKFIIVSGGVGKSGYDEATAMQAYVLRKGVPASAIIRDSEGINTRASAKFTAEYMRKHRIDSVIVVSQFYHLARAEMALEQEGANVAGKAYARYFELDDILSTLREIPANIFYFLHLK